MNKFFLVIAIVACCTGDAYAMAVPDRPAGRVSDYANLLTPAQRTELADQLAEVERATTNQIVIAIFPSLEGENLEAFSMRLAEKWRIGLKEKDNGVIISVFVKDRKVRIEVGYGLEADLPDVTCRRIIAEEMTPRFHRQDYAGGLKAAVSRLNAVRTADLQTAIDSGMPRYGADIANRLDANDQTSLINQLMEDERLTGIRIVCVLFPSLEQRTLPGVSAELSRRWLRNDSRAESTVLIVAFARERQAAVILEPGLRSRFPDAFLDTGVPRMIFKSSTSGEAALLAAANHVTWALMGDYDYERMVPRSWQRAWRQRDEEARQFHQYANAAFCVLIFAVLIIFLGLLRRRFGGGGGSGSSGDWSSGGSSSTGGGGSSGGGGSFGGGGASGSW